MIFDKYDKNGAYHWRQANIRNFREYHPVVAARYTRAMQLVPQKSKRVVDLGCGDGYLVHLLALQGHEVIGIDLDSTGIHLAKEKLSEYQDQYRFAPQLLIGSAYYLPFDENSIDCIVATEVIEHLEKPAAMLSEIRRTLKLTGSTIISTPHRNSIGVVEPYHYREYTTEELVGELSPYFSNTKVFGMTSHKRIEWYQYQRNHVSKPRVMKLLVWLMCSVGFNPLANPFRMNAKKPLVLFAQCWNESTE